MAQNETLRTRSRCTRFGSFSITNGEKIAESSQSLTMRVLVVIGALLLPCSSPDFGQAPLPSDLSADEVVARMFARDTQRESLEGGYTGNRRYVLDNHGFNKRAEMLVRVKCDSDGTKHFEVVSEEGWKSANKYVLRKMLESEAETSLPLTRPATRMTPDNYSFQMSGSDLLDARPVYVIQVLPKRHDRYLFEGRIWVDAQDYALVRAEGKPAKNPSFWTRSVYFVHQYQKAGLFWFPLSTESITEVRIFGKTQVTISYFDYAPNFRSVRDFSNDAGVSVSEGNYALTKRLLPFSITKGLCRWQTDALQQ